MATNLLAQLTNPVLPPLLGGGDAPDYTTGGTVLGKLITSIIGALFIAGFLLAFLTLITGGITWITAGGDKTKLETSRNQITNAIIGIIIVGAAWAITQLVAMFMGLDLNALPIPVVGQ